MTKNMVQSTIIPLLYIISFTKLLRYFIKSGYFSFYRKNHSNYITDGEKYP